MSFSFSVRSGARMTTRSASERLSSGTWSPSYTSKTRTLRTSLPPARRACSTTAAAGTSRATMTARSWEAGGYVPRSTNAVVFSAAAANRSMLSEAKYTARSSTP